MPLHSLDLVLDAESDAWVRADWAALAGAGLPSQAHHRGATNAPHATLAAATSIDAAARARVADALGPLLPLTLPLAGVVLFGRGPYTLARLLAPGAQVDELARGVRHEVGDPHAGAWAAHVTLARRVPVEDVGAALAAVATGREVRHDLVVVGLRHWNPDAGTAELLAGRDAPEPR